MFAQVDSLGNVFSVNSQAQLIANEIYISQTLIPHLYICYKMFRLLNT